MDTTELILDQLAKATSPCAHQLVLNFIIELNDENIMLKRLLNSCQEELVRLYTENSNLKASFKLLDELTKK